MEQFRGLLAEQLSDANRDQIEAHVERCDACQRTLEELSTGQAVERSRSTGVAESESRNEPGSGFLRLLKLGLPERAPGLKLDNGESETRVPSPLGDFRLLREIGRGGMGVVYEAEQMSLGRRVALKVLPFASTLDPKQLQRFKNEAQAAAHLHHTNIVPVHATGCERGVHFYAMEFIDGQSLAAVIAALRATVKGRMTNDHSLTDDDSQKTSAYVPSCNAGTEVRQSTSGLLPTLGVRDPSFFRSVAQLGIQAAEALDHAHQLGIIHRDIKPANLLIEGEPGALATGVRLWITDFGLAHMQSQGGLTMTGDLIGTLRYMSPEQALAKRVLVDHRTDIYSLGVTLYELLTLEPAFGGRDRQELLRQIAFEEPIPPRRLDRGLPAELETIVLKAMEKNPADRYATAQDLADDLRRFLEDKPIRAKRPTLVQRGVKWVRRHQAVSWMGAAVLALLAVGSTISAIIIAQQRNLAEQRRQDAEHERNVARQEEKRANDERDRAKRAEAKAEATNQFLVRNILTFSPPGRFGYRASDTTVAQALEAAAQDVETAFSGQPELEASVRLTIGNTYFLMGRFKEAAHHLGKGLDLRGNLLSDSTDPWSREYAETAFATKRLGLALQALGQNEKAKPFLLRGGEARRRIEIRRIPFKVNAWPFTLNPVLVALSPDGRWLLVGGDDAFFRLYDVATGVEIHRIEAHSEQAVAFSPNGRHALSGGQDKTMRLWDVFTAKELRRFTGHTDHVYFVAFSPDGRRALSAGKDKTLRLWDVQSGKEIRQFLGHTDVICNAAFSPEGSRILSASKDGTIRLWEVRTGRELRSFPRNWTGAVNLVVFSPDGRRALSTHNDGQRLWDVETGEELRRIPDSAGFGEAAFTPDGGHAVHSGDKTGKWTLWNLDTGKEVRSYYVEPPVRPKRILVSSDGRLAICGNWRGSISTWRLDFPPPMGRELAAARQYYDQKRRELGADAPIALQALDEWAALHMDRDEPADAGPLFVESLERKLRIFGKEHPATMASRKNLARALKEQKKLAEAEKLLRQCLEIYRRVQGREHPDVIVARDGLADILEEQGMRDEADGLLRQCLKGWNRLLGPGHPETLAALRKVVSRRQAHGKPVDGELPGIPAGYLYAEMGEWDKALAAFTKAFELELPKDPDVCFDYACLLVQQGDMDRYRKLCGRVLERLDQRNNDNDVSGLAHMCVLAPQAIADANRVVQLALQRMARAAPGSGGHAWSYNVLALAYYRAGQYGKAVETLREFLKDGRGGELDVADWLVRAMAELRLGHAAKALGWFDKADRWIEQRASISVQQRHLPASPASSMRQWMTIQVLHREAEALIRGKISDQPGPKKTDEPDAAVKKP
jgi:serine/threonine protein kinase